MKQPIIQIENVSKQYKSGHQALKNVTLDVHKGEILALLGPNGAGKTTLISILCGIVTRTSGEIKIDGMDIDRDYRKIRSEVGLVPQELATDAFESVIATVRFSRGLFGKTPNDAFIEELLKSLTLWDKRDSKIMSLSGGMKRRLLIAKALSHEPTILFLDEPTAGVDVELRHDMWTMVKTLREQGVTVILTTHYIEEAEEMADRIGIINHGELKLVQDKASLLSQLGKKRLTIQLQTPLESVPEQLASYALHLDDSGLELHYEFNQHQDTSPPVPKLLNDLNQSGIEFKDLHTQQSSLEDIFVSLVKEAK